MNNHLVPDRALSRNPGPREQQACVTVTDSALPGSLGDLVARALRGRPIYCIPAPGVRGALMAAVVASFHRDFPGAEFVNARDVYRHRDDWRRRWRAERERYGAAIVITLARTKGASPPAEVAGGHVIDIFTSIEIESLTRLGRPVAWHAVVFPYNQWIARFAIEPFDEIRTSRYARLLPAADAEPFRPFIGPSPLFVIRDGPGSAQVDPSGGN